MAATAPPPEPTPFRRLVLYAFVSFVGLLLLMGLALELAQWAGWYTPAPASIATPGRTTTSPNYGAWFLRALLVLLLIRGWTTRRR